MLDKTALRKALLARRKALSPAQAEAHAAAVTAHIQALDLWVTASKVLLYMPIHNELDTSSLLKEAWRTGKRVYLPRCDATVKGHMDMAQCRGPEDLISGAYGILEPRLDCPILDMSTPAQAAPAIDLALIPAVAFDLEGNRLGYGGGYYDRFLAHAAMLQTCRIGLAHALQVVESLPREPWDCPMHAVVTEHGLRWGGGRKL